MTLETTTINPPMHRFFNGYVLFGLTFLYQVIWIFQGLNLTDHGYHLTNQVRLIGDLGGPNVRAGMTFFTNLVGGLWLSVIGSPSLIWARLGGVLIFSLNALISYKILLAWFDRKKVFLVVLACTPAITMGTLGCMIQYFTFPSLLVNVALLFFNGILNAPADSRSLKLHSALLGFISIPTILSRFPLAMMALVPVIVVLYCRFTRTDTTRFKRAVPYLAAGILAGVAVFGLLYAGLGVLGSYVTTTTGGVQSSAAGGAAYRRSMSFMLVGYCYDFRFILETTTIVCLLLYVASLLRGRFGNATVNAGLAVLLLLGSIAIAVAAEPYFYVLKITFLQAGLILLVTFVFFRHDRGKSTNVSLLLLVSVYLMLVTPLGSNTGLKKLVHGMWIPLPLAALVALSLGRKMIGQVRGMMQASGVMLLFLFLVGLFLHFSNAFTDCPNRFELTAGFEYKHLRHVYTTSARAEVLDEALLEIDRLVDKGDETLMLNSIPMLYYLTETQPVLGCCWLPLRSLEQVKAMYATACKEKRYPSVIVVCRARPWQRDWPGEMGFKKDDRRKFEFLLDEYKTRFKYKRTLKNGVFEIYSRPPALTDTQGPKP